MIVCIGYCLLSLLMLDNVMDERDYTYTGERDYTYTGKA